MTYSIAYDEESDAWWISDGETEQAFDTPDEATLHLAQWIGEDE